MKRFGWKIGLIIGATLIGLACMWPPSKKLKLGIDLSGGTILVYEVERENLPANFNMDELITALKKRADPEGVKEIPIRKIGGNRIEIILPQASNEEVEDVKKMLTDVGSLEFRILANGKHDRDVVKAALGPRGLSRPPKDYKWARLGEVSTGTKQNWKKDVYAGSEVALTSKETGGNARTEVVKVRRNTANTLTLDRPHGLKSIASYRVEFNPSRIRGGDPNNLGPGDVIVREEKVAPGRTETWILCNLDRPGREVTGKYLKQVRPDVDDRLQPAVRFEFNSRGASRFGDLTRDHKPEEGGAFRYQLAILLDNLVMSAPALNSEASRVSRPRKWNT